MKMLTRAALGLFALLVCAPAVAQHATVSVAPAGYAPEQACVTWTGATIGSGTLVPCPAVAGSGGGGSNAAAGAIGSAVPGFASYTGYVGADGNLHGWLGDNAGHPLVSIFGTPTIGNTVFGATQSGAWSVTATQPDTYGTGTIAAATLNATYVITPANGQSTAGFVVTGLSAAGAVLTIEASNDGSNWASVSGVLAGTGLTATTLTTDGQFRVNASGRRGIRLRVSTVGTGTITASSTLSQAPFDPPTPQRDTNGDLRLQTVTLTPFFVSLAANTSTTILAINAARVGFDIQCATGGLTLSRIGAAITAALPTNGGGDLAMPGTTLTYFTPAYASKIQAVTGYTATAQACWGVSYAQQ